MKIHKHFLIFLLLSISLLLNSCSKNEDAKELEITYLKNEPNEKSIQNQAPSGSISYHPNPFNDRVTFHKTGNEDVIIYIANSKGDFKEITVSDPSFILDFTNEEQGSYYMEVKIGEYVLRDHLLKFDN